MSEASAHGRRAVWLALLALLLALAGWPLRQRFLRQAELYRQTGDRARQQQQAILGEIGQREAVLMRALRQVAADPDDVGALRTAASALGRQRFYADALFLLRHAARVRPQEAETWRALGEIYHALNYFDRAVEAYCRAQELQPANVEHALRLGYLYVALGWNPLARQVMKAQLERAPDEARLQAALGLVENQAANLTDASAYLSRAVELEPDNARFLILLADTRLMETKLDEALALADQAIRREPRQVDHLLEKAHILNAFPSQDPRRLHDIIDLCQQVLQINPQELSARFMRGLACQDLGRSAEARQEFEAVFRRRPDFQSVALELGKLYQQEGDAEEADFLLSYHGVQAGNGRQRKHLNVQLTLRPYDPQAHWEFARFNVRHQDHSLAVTGLWRTLDLDARHPGAGHQLLQALYRAERVEEIPERDRQFGLIRAGGS